jgi:hypothetical protein
MKIRRWWRDRNRLSLSRTTRGGVSYIDPLRAGRHPFQIYLLGLSVISGAPILLGSIGAESVERQLPFWLAFCWGLALLVGAGIALIGCYWPGDYVNALTIERVGLAVIGAAAIVYGVVIMFDNSNSIPSRIIPVAIILAYGFACLRRARDIGRIIQLAIGDLQDLKNGEPE